MSNEDNWTSSHIPGFPIDVPITQASLHNALTPLQVFGGIRTVLARRVVNGTVYTLPVLLCNTHGYTIPLYGKCVGMVMGVVKNDDSEIIWDWQGMQNCEPSLQEKT